MKNAYKVSQILQDAGFSAYVVGGAVRDSIMGQEPKDWDIATDATPDQVTDLFSVYWKVIPTGIEYGTVTVLMAPVNQEPEPIEITTFRADQTYSDGRRPDAVTFSKTIEEDLARRDFTCNAIAWDVVNSEFVDPYNGRKDIADGVLKCVGDPLVRFGEDGLRLMRAVRFSCTKDFTIDTDSLLAMTTCSENIKSVSKERIRDELLKILSSGATTKGFATLLCARLLDHICPELLDQIGLDQNRYHALPCWEHTMLCLAQCESKDPIMRLAVLLHDIAKPTCQTPHPTNPGEYRFLRHEDVGADMAISWMREYKFSNEDIARVAHIIQHHLIMYDTKWSNAAVRRWVQRVGKDSIPDLICMARCDLLGKALDVTKPLARLQELLDRIDNMKAIVTKSSELAINGNDVMKIMGVTKGNARVGETMKFLLDMVTERPEYNNREQLLLSARTYLDVTQSSTTKETNHD